ncbi:uncharacterized protein LOC141674127 [Apium graveolens]|uniref:uncharacterized protein LOC141674127 n=1 Tax=Apium graveolens TaxID=4045 RepID=UPI003D7A7170
MGKGFILSSGFVGLQRYIQQNFQDALVVCHFIGHPDIFLIMTTNPLWDEVLEMMKLFPQCSPQNSPNVMARVFRYYESTMFDQSGFPVYRRRKAKITIKRGKVDLDNQWVVPYNRDLLVKYQCHINVEICAHARSLKYLFKYCLKGHDRAIVEIRGWKRKLSFREGMDVYEDEIQSYFDGRYISGCEVAYMVFGFSIHYRSLVVKRLSFHLSGRKPCTFRATERLAKVASREREKRNRLWVPRKRGNKIGRLAYSHHTSGEIWFLRLLLTKVRGATSFQSLRTMKGKVCANFQEACRDFGLLDDDNEWHQVTNLNALWNDHWVDMVDDLVKKQWEITCNPNLILDDGQPQFYALAEIHNILKSIRRSLEDYAQLPQPPHSYMDCGLNNFIIEETSYDIAEMEREFLDMYSRCNAEQLEVYNTFMQSVDRREGACFLCMVAIVVVVDPGHFDLPFGGITVVLGGDFHQILPVITRASRDEIISSSITRSKIWKLARVFKLTQNMRLNRGNSLEEVQNLRDFAAWVLDVGDGIVGTPNRRADGEGGDDISDQDYMSERAILTPTNQTVGRVNSLIVERLPGELSSYFSVDTAEDFPGLGCRIHSFVSAQLIQTFEEKLEEGMVYNLENFKVRVYNGDETNRVVRNSKQKKFTFNSRLEKDLASRVKIPKYSFNFFSLSQLNSLKNDNRYLTGLFHLRSLFLADVVGVVQDVQSRTAVNRLVNCQVLVKKIDEKKNWFRLYSLYSNESATSLIVWPDHEISRLAGKIVYDVDADVA